MINSEKKFIREKNLNPIFKRNFPLITDAFDRPKSNNLFTVFKSFENYLVLIYCDYENRMISYDLERFKVFNKVDNKHSEMVQCIKHFKDEKNKKDLIISISPDNYNLKLWEASKLLCLLNLENI